MLEINSATLVHDEQLARQVAEAELPFRELSIQAKSIGNLALGTQLEGAANEVSTMYLSRYQEVNRDAIIANTPGEQSVQQNENEKKAYSAEAIDELLKSTFVAAKYYVDKGGENTTVVLNGEKAASMSGHSHGDHNLNPGALLLGDMTRNTKSYEKTEVRLFEQEGVSEIVTLLYPAAEVAELSNGFAPDYGTSLGHLKLIAGAELNGEPLKVLNYKILRASDRFQYTDPRGRGGAPSEYLMVLPASEAEALYSAMQTDPNLARTVNDAIMLKVLDASLYRNGRNTVKYTDDMPEDPKALWDSRKPPYEEWKRNNAGVAQMAFRTHLKSGPSESTIVKF